MGARALIVLTLLFGSVAHAALFETLTYQAPKGWKAKTSAQGVTAARCTS